MLNRYFLRVLYVPLTLVVLLNFLGCREETRPTTPAPPPPEFPPPLDVSEKQKTMSFSEIELLIKEKEIKSVEEFLSVLPPQNLMDYSMAYESRSLQAASYALPRVILRTERAKLLMAFNAGKDQNGNWLAGGSNIEVIEYVPEKRAFQFHEIEFAKNAGAVGSVSKNVQMCSICHGGTDPRPNWASYLRWAGMYGSVDDFLGDSRNYEDSGYRGERDSYDGTSLPPNIKEIVESERLGIKTHHDAWRKHPRYKFLADINEQEYAKVHFSKRPNFFMQSQIHELNMERLTRIIQSEPNYKHYRYTIVGALGCFNDWPAKSKDYFPEGQAPPVKFGIEELEQGKRSLKTETWDPFFWLFETRNISTRGWESVYRRDYPYTADPFYQGASHPRDASYRHLAWLLVQSDSEMKDLFEFAGMKRSPNKYKYQGPLYEDFNESVCGQLRQRSHKSLTDLWAQNESERKYFQRAIFRSDEDLFFDIQPSVEPSEDVRNNRRTFGRLLLKTKCSVCHDPAIYPAPVLPFTSEEVLRKTLCESKGLLSNEIADRTRANPKTGTRMPLGGPALPDEERRSVLEYIQSLTPSPHPKSKLEVCL